MRHRLFERCNFPSNAQTYRFNNNNRLGGIAATCPLPGPTTWSVKSMAVTLDHKAIPTTGSSGCPWRGVAKASISAGMDNRDSQGIEYLERPFHMCSMKPQPTISDRRLGRPRAFDRDQALEAALRAFWRTGYEATSIEDLTSAMGISRSSLYSCFGSKHDVLLEVLTHYSRAGVARLAEIAESQRDGTVHDLLAALSNSADGSHGCLMVNCITELAPHDPKVADLGRHHLESLVSIVAHKLDPSGSAPSLSAATALISLALGVQTLRKSGYDPALADAALADAGNLIVPET